MTYFFLSFLDSFLAVHCLLTGFQDYFSKPTSQKFPPTTIPALQMPTCRPAFLPELSPCSVNFSKALSRFFLQTGSQTGIPCCLHLSWQLRYSATLFRFSKKKRRQSDCRLFRSYDWTVSGNPSVILSDLLLYFILTGTHTASAFFPVCHHIRTVYADRVPVCPGKFHTAWLLYHFSDRDLPPRYPLPR